MIFVFDLDDTLWCINGFMPNYHTLFVKYGVSKREWFRDYNHARARGLDYSPLLQYNRLKKSGIAKGSYKKFRADYFAIAPRVEKHIHERCFSLLKKLKRDGHRVIILTKGFAWYQRLKVKLSGIADIADEVIVTTVSKHFALKKISQRFPGERMVFVDDSQRQIAGVKLTMPEVFVVQSFFECCRDKLTKTELADRIAYSPAELEEVITREKHNFVPRIKIKDFGTENAALLAANMLARGKVISVPTETSYGLATDATKTSSIKRIYAVKNRDESKRIPYMVRDREQLKKYTSLSKEQEKWVRRYENKVVSFLAPKRPKKLTKVGGVVRKATHPFLKAIAKDFHSPFTITSTNISGEPSIFSFSEYQNQFKNQKFQVDAFFDYGKLTPKPASTILDITTMPPTVLRQGSTKIKIKNA